VRAPKGISERPDAFSWTVPHVMSTQELHDLAARYVDVAIRLERTGFNGVELHGAHGYLLTQLLSPWSNDRDDEFGGSVENRTRFVRMVAEGIRQSCGPDFIVGLKMPGDEGVRPGIDPDEARRIATQIQSEGLIDYLALSQGNFSLSLENHVPDMHFREAHFKDLSANIRPHVSPLPVMSIGHISRPETAAKLLDNGVCDIVGLSRALIADANWVKKAEQGELDDIRPATYTNVSWGEVQGGRPMEEENNPELASEGEADWTPGKTASPLTVAVVGSGPAGLEAAWVLAARGHDVTLFGKSSQAGGKVRLISTLPDYSHFNDCIGWQVRRAERFGVKMQLGTEVSAADVTALSPDLVILAAGSEQILPEGLDEADGRTVARAVAEGLDGISDGTVLLYDLDQTAATYAVVDTIAKKHKTILVTPRTEFAKGVNYCSAIGVFRRLHNADVDMIPANEVVERKGDIVVLRNVYTGKTSEISGVKTLLWSSPRHARGEMASQIQEKGIRVEMIGDSVAPRNLLCAIHEGRAVAMRY
jgi:thioredoxin reductase